VRVACQITSAIGVLARRPHQTDRVHHATVTRESQPRSHLIAP
jgi:hypothetical protein